MTNIHNQGKMFLFEILEEIDPGVFGIMHKGSKIVYVADTNSGQVHCVHPIHMFEDKDGPWPAWDRTKEAIAMFIDGLKHSSKNKTLINHNRHVSNIFDEYTRWSAERCKCGGECLTARQKIMDVLLKENKKPKDKEKIESLIEGAMKNLNKALELYKKTYQ